MIRSETSHGVRLITQRAHAFICGQIAQRWQLPFQPQDEMHLAAAIHDSGWLERDSKPQINTHGQPRTFTELDLDDHFEIWQRSIARVSDTSQYAGLMVSLHATNLYQRRLAGGNDPKVVQDQIHHFLRNQEEYQHAVQHALRSWYGSLVQNAHLQQNRELLQVWDLVSLMLCMGQPRSAHKVPMGNGKSLILAMDNSGSLSITPWVFEEDTVNVHAEGRILQRQSFRSDAHLQQAYDAAPTQTFMLVIRKEQDQDVK